MSKYDVNFKRLALLLLPTFWRKPRIGALLYALVSPLSRLHVLLRLFREQTDYRLTHNGQVCFLRAVLNDLFDPADRRITISDAAADTGGLHLYRRERNRPALVPNRERAQALILNRRGFGGVNALDFAVNLPVAFDGVVDESRLRAVVNTYKQASKRFAINYNIQ